MGMVVQPAPFPALGYDCITVMDATRASALKAAGMAFAIRYLGSVTAAELAIILDAGLLFMPVTFSREPGWVPTPGMGTQDGQVDVQHLQALGLPKGCTVWIDLEGVASTVSAADVATWINDRAAVIQAAGYDAGLYVGAGDGLDGGQLYALANINRYWRSLSDVPQPSCGWALMQLYKTVTLAGTEVDIDCVQFDFQDRLVSMVAHG